MIKLFSKEARAKVKLRARKAWEGAKDLSLGIGVGATIGCAFTGYVMSIINSRRINSLEKDHEELTAIVDNNAECGLEDRRHICDLERQTNLLMEKALKITEGDKPAE